MKIGELYSVDRRTALMPDPDPDDFEEALGLIRSIPVGHVVKVEGQRRVRLATWYQIAVLKDGREIAAGWINSSVLTLHPGTFRRIS